MTDQQLKQLLEKYQTGSCTPEEERLVQQWYESFENEEDGIQNLSEPQKAALENKIRQQIDNQLQAPSDRKIIFLQPYVRISAAAILIIFFGYFSWNWVQKERIEADFVTFASGTEIKKVILSDGSLVWLKANSQLKYPRQFEKDAKVRTVELQGEALFEVAKNPKQPFLIQCGRVQAKVLGTSFHVKQSPEKQQVAIVVLTGKVAVTNNESAEPVNSVVLEPMEMGTTSPNGFTKTRVQSTSGYIQGTSYDMHFDETPIQEVLARIERKFDVEITYPDVNRDCRITADFTDQSQEITLQLLASTLGEVSYQVKGNTILFEGKSCQ
ncbi:DUF4974 domain-containing protein [Rhodocytophaga rosea]|uniref:DUF4974 domain-containing protein n=1 Tax=Rhodocytophaga rosea TaxID=2704465 RepID=A0A6C0GMD9_9BACT|nr:FecR domain-containing protein [Rhodocytophaga rosea]QHT68793.1 DUF4974 domain-containing protein [Rhodocytophaga rosea]